jgi:hypothetical protein
MHTAVILPNDAVATSPLTPRWTERCLKLRSNCSLVRPISHLLVMRILYTATHTEGWSPARTSAMVHHS